LLITTSYKFLLEMWLGHNLTKPVCGWRMRKWIVVVMSVFGYSLVVEL